MSKDKTAKEGDAVGHSDTGSVGYGRPPKHTRFKKGQSGNRKGRPRGRQNVSKVASKIFDMRIPVKTEAGVIELPFIEALIQVHKAKALQGDKSSQRALSVIMEQLGYFDESQVENKFYISSNERFTEEEWVWAYGPYMTLQHEKRIAREAEQRAKESG